MFNNLFTPDKVNTGRQIELDIAKAFSIIFLILTHSAIAVSTFGNFLSPTYEYLINSILGSPCAAPVFMFCMGVSIVYSRNSKWNLMIKRGVKLIF